MLRTHAERAGLELAVASRGTQGYHAGEPPDPRAQRHAKKRGYDLSDLRSTRIGEADFETFELILACDRGHYEALIARAPAHARDKIVMFRADGDDLPDPYYDGPAAFEAVLDVVEAECARLVAELSR